MCPKQLGEVSHTAPCCFWPQSSATSSGCVLGASWGQRQGRGDVRLWLGLTVVSGAHTVRNCWLGAQVCYGGLTACLTTYGTPYRNQDPPVGANVDE